MATTIRYACGCEETVERLAPCYQGSPLPTEIWHDFACAECHAWAWRRQHSDAHARRAAALRGE